VSRKLLITGATGGLGMSLTQEALLHGYEVFALGRDSKQGASLKSLGARFVQADITNLTSFKNYIEGMDGIIHAAALSAPWGARSDFEAINFTATIELVKAAKSAGVQRFLFISSPSVYTRLKDQIGLRETDPIAKKYLNDYQDTKARAEAYVISQASQSFYVGAIRPRAIIGPYDKVILPRLIDYIDKGFFPLLRSGSALFDMTDVRDVTMAILNQYEALDRLNGEVFNISGGQPITIYDLMIKLAQSREKSINFISLPYGLVLPMAYLTEAIYRFLPKKWEPKLTPYLLATMAFSQTFDLSKANQSLGYQPKHNPVQTLIDLARSMP